MSDAVWVAIITGVCTALPLVLVQLVQLVKVLRQVEDQAETTRSRITTVEAKIEHNTRLTETAALDVRDARLMAKGAERAGYEGGIEEGKRQATGPMGLRTDLSPLTDHGSHPHG